MKTARQFKDGYTRDFYAAVGDGQPDCVDSFVADLQSWAAEIRAAALREAIKELRDTQAELRAEGDDGTLIDIDSQCDALEALIAKEPGT